MPCRLAAVAAFAALTLPAPAVADPQYKGIYVARIGTSPTDVTLERQRTKVKMRMKALGLGGVNISFVVPGERSTVRLASGENLSLLVRIADDSADPMTLIKISKAKVSKGNREFSGVSTSFGSFTGRSKEAEPVLFEVKTYRPLILRIVLPPALPAGEYCATTAPNFDNPEPDSFCFGIN